MRWVCNFIHKLAWWPPHEFDLSWSLLLALMETEWGEPGAAKYIRGNIVQVVGDRIQAKWQSDPSAVPPGYTA